MKKVCQVLPPHHDDSTAHRIYKCRHVVLKNTLSFLRLEIWKSTTAGMVSTLNDRRAYGNRHNLRQLVGTMTLI